MVALLLFKVCTNFEFVNNGRELPTYPPKGQQLWRAGMKVRLAVSSLTAIILFLLVRLSVATFCPCYGCYSLCCAFLSFLHHGAIANVSASSFSGIALLGRLCRSRDCRT